MDARAYDRWYEAHRDAFSKELSLLLSVFKGGRGAELGAGTGRFGGAIGAEVLLDINREMLGIAMKRVRDVIIGDMCSPPFRDGAFDYGLFSFSLGFSDCPRLGRLTTSPFKKDIYVLDVDQDHTEAKYIRSLESWFGPFRLSIKDLVSSAAEMGLQAEGPLRVHMNIDGSYVTVFVLRLFRPF